VDSGQSLEKYEAQANACASGEHLDSVFQILTNSILKISLVDR